jgi:hypothetical protein
MADYLRSGCDNGRCGLLYHRQWPCANPDAMAFSSEVAAGSREENASKQESKARF